MGSNSIGFVILKWTSVLPIKGAKKLFNFFLTPTGFFFNGLDELRDDVVSDINCVHS